MSSKIEPQNLAVRITTSLQRARKLRFPPVDLTQITESLAKIDRKSLCTDTRELNKKLVAAGGEDAQLPLDEFLALTAKACEDPEFVVNTEVILGRCRYLPQLDTENKIEILELIPEILDKKNRETLMNIDLNELRDLENELKNRAQMCVSLMRESSYNGQQVYYWQLLNLLCTAAANELEEIILDKVRA